MSDPHPSGRLKALLRPRSTRAALGLALIGVLTGVIAMIAFEGVMHATSTEKFCVSCHEMDSPYAQVRNTSHYSNASGIQAGCSDCHVPQEFGPKMVRKIQAAREVWGSITGIIDTPEKYAAHAITMKQREINRLIANDSQECRNCHEAARMATNMQSEKARRYHQNMDQNGKTCIYCHAGIAHPEFAEGLNTAMQ